jgi:hypothetical protein
MFHLQSSETLKNLSPELLADIKRLSSASLGSMAKIFEEGIAKGEFVNEHPVAIADIVWALFSGLVLLEESKRIFNRDSNYLKSTLESAFEILGRGIRETPAASTTREPSG